MMTQGQRGERESTMTQGQGGEREHDDTGTGRRERRIFEDAKWVVRFCYSGGRVV